MYMVAKCFTTPCSPCELIFLNVAYELLIQHVEEMKTGNEYRQFPCNQSMYTIHCKAWAM